MSRIFSRRNEPNFICFLTNDKKIYYAEISTSVGCGQIMRCNSISCVINTILDIQTSGKYNIIDLSSPKINLFEILMERQLIAMFFIQKMGSLIKEIDSARIISDMNEKEIREKIKQAGLNTNPFQITLNSKYKTLIFTSDNEIRSRQLDREREREREREKSEKEENDRIQLLKLIERGRKARSYYESAGLDRNGRSLREGRTGIKGGNKYDKYTLNDLKQIAIDNKIKITKMVIISNDELHKKLKDKNIIINKNIKLEDFKRILKENNIKITKKVNLTKQELIKKLEIQI